MERPDNSTECVRARGAFGFLIAGRPDPVQPDSDTEGSQVPVLYPHDRPEFARLAAFVPRFGIPLLLIALGCVFTPVAAFTQTKCDIPRVAKLLYIGFLVLTGMTGAVLGILLSYR